MRGNGVQRIMSMVLRSGDTDLNEKIWSRTVFGGWDLYFRNVDISISNKIYDSIISTKPPIKN